MWLQQFREGFRMVPRTLRIGVFGALLLLFPLHHVQANDDVSMSVELDTTTFFSLVKFDLLFGETLGVLNWRDLVTVRGGVFVGQFRTLPLGGIGVNLSNFIEELGADFKLDLPDWLPLELGGLAGYDFNEQFVDWGAGLTILRIKIH